MRPGIGSALVGSTLFLLAASSGAQQSGQAEPVRIEYSAPLGCPSAEGFAQRFLDHSRRARLALPSEPARRITVVVEPSEDGNRGQATVFTRLGPRVVGTVRAGTCEGAVEALALETASAVDAAVLTDSADAEAASAGDTGGDDGVHPVGADDLPNEPAEAPVESHSAADDSTGDPRGGAPAKPSRRLGIALTLSDQTGATAPGGLLFGDLLAWRPGGSLRLAGFASRDGTNDAGIDAHFTLVAARASLCPTRLALAIAIGLAPCFGVDAGVLSGRADGVVSNTTQRLSWSAANATLRLGVELSRRIRLEGEGGAVVPFARHSFAVNTGSGILAIRRVPSLGTWGQLGASASFF